MCPPDQRGGLGDGGEASRPHTHINLLGIQEITCITVKTLAIRCHHLEYIHLGFCTNVNDATLMKIAEHCSKLEDLCVYGCPAVTTAGLTEIGSQCSKLKTVYIDQGLRSSEAQLQKLFPHVSWR